MNPEHLGLMEPQNCDLETRRTTDFMRPAPHPIKDERHLGEDQAVADPLAAQTISLWENIARRNREIFTELFRPVPTNLVRTRAAYKVGRDQQHRVPLWVPDSGLGFRRTFPTSRMGTLCLECPCSASRIDYRKYGATSLKHLL